MIMHEQCKMYVSWICDKAMVQSQNFDKPTKNYQSTNLVTRKALTLLFGTEARVFRFGKITDTLTKI